MLFRVEPDIGVCLDLNDADEHLSAVLGQTNLENVDTRIDREAGGLLLGAVWQGEKGPLARALVQKVARRGLYWAFFLRDVARNYKDMPHVGLMALQSA